PARLFDAFTAYQRTAALKAAIELDLFSAIGARGATAAEAAERTSASQRGVRILCDRLAVDGFLTKTGDRYGLATEAALFLDRSSPAYLGSAITFIASPAVKAGFDLLTDAVRRGGTAVSEAGTMAPEHPMWVEFARAMAPMAAMSAEMLNLALGDLPIRGSVLDVAAGHGLYGITIARHHPEARIVAQDWASVLAVARENAERADVAARWSALPGSAFDVDLGRDHALVLLTNFLHHFDPPTNESLLRRVHASLAPGGRVAAVEFVPNEDRVSPPEAAAFSLTMLAGTAAGDAYTFSEYERMFSAVGFSRIALAELAPTPQRVVIAVR